jgi:hypothetical protein
LSFKLGEKFDKASPTSSWPVVPVLEACKLRKLTDVSFFGLNKMREFNVAIKVLAYLMTMAFRC